MTMTTPKPSAGASPARGAIQWTVVQSGLWVGKINGEFAGMIEARRGEGFTATTHLAKHLGVFATVDEAKARFRE
ncbi:MAG: hypothetical protein JWR04_464 [Rhodoglobus sp.]|nr:hypothetical protein [Rhodoglobus sp.]